MVEYDFCLTQNNLICTIETILSVIPIVAFIVLGFYSYKQTKDISAYAREPFTKRHIVKLAFSATLSIGSFAFLLVYLLAESQVSIKTVVTWGITSFLWIFNSVLMRKEFEKLGFTTNNLKVAWLTMFVCQTILLIMAAAGANKDSFKKVVVPYCINEVSLLVIVLLGYFYSDDYPSERKPADLYSSIASDVGLEVDEEAYRTLTNPLRKSIVDEERKEQDNFKPFAAENGYQPREPRSRRVSDLSGGNNPNLAVSTERGKENNWRTSNPSAPINLREEVNNIERIAVVDHQDTIRFDKQTILYVIEYYIRGQKFVTRRSNSEFLFLYKEIKKDNIAVDLSMYPTKKLLSKTEEVIEDRKEGFDRFLKVLISERVASNYLKEFLQTPNNLPYYGKISKKDSAKLVPPYNSISSEAAANKPLLPEGHEALRLDSSEKSDSAVLNPSANRLNSSNKFSESVRVKNYKVDIVRSFKGAEDSIYYTIKIKEQESGNEIIIVKRYREFKSLHDQLKKTVKGHKDKIPELPNKGKAGPLANADDPRVVEHRKKKLPEYLQKILNTPEFYDNQAISQFLQSSAQH